MSSHRASGGTPSIVARERAFVATAAEFGAEALTVLTVSDHLLDHSADMSPEDRETRFATALRLAVAAALS